MDYAYLGTPTASLILKNLPFVVFLTFLGVIYVANIHYAENKIREIKAVESEIQQLRWKYMAAKSDLMYHSQQSEVLKRVKDIGLSDSGKRPKKIIVQKGKHDSKTLGDNE